MSTESRELPEWADMRAAILRLDGLTRRDCLSAFDKLKAALAHSRAQDSGGEAVVATGRYFADGPQGWFVADDLALTTALVYLFDMDGDWTITDTHNPTGTAEQPAKVEGCNCGAIAVGDADQRRHHFDCPAYATTQPAAPSAQAMSEFDRIEFALRDAGIDYDRAFEIARMATTQPAGAAVEAVAWMADDDTGRVIDAKAKRAGERASATGSATSVYSIPLGPIQQRSEQVAGAAIVHAIRLLEWTIAEHVCGGEEEADFQRAIKGLEQVAGGGGVDEVEVMRRFCEQHKDEWEKFYFLYGPEHGGCRA